MRIIILGAILAMTCAPVGAQVTVTVNVSNPLNQARGDEPVVLPLHDYGDVRSALVTADGQEIACQLDDLDQDEQYDELCFLATLGAMEQKRYSVTLYTEGEPRQYPARVYAEMLMRNDKVKEKNRHDNYIESITARGDCANSYNLQHHHGVDFESELNGIRIYFDKRQTLDLYGKFKKRLELKETQFYTSAEQKTQGYGDDVLWVGNTFGLGAFRGWDGHEPTMIEPVRSRTQRIISYGPLRTIVEIADRGWQLPAPAAGSTTPSTTTDGRQLTTVNMTLRYTQYAGHRDTDIDVLFSKDMSSHCFSTGIIDVKDSQEFSDHKGLRACWGTDYPSTDTVNWKRETVGLAICIPRQFIVTEVPSARSHAATTRPQPAGMQGGNYTFVVKPRGNRMRYKVTYTSANEEFGYHSAQQWFDYLKQWKQQVEAPVAVTVE